MTLWTSRWSALNIISPSTILTDRLVTICLSRVSSFRTFLSRVLNRKHTIPSFLASFFCKISSTNNLFLSVVGLASASTSIRQTFNFTSASFLRRKLTSWRFKRNYSRSASVRVRIVSWSGRGIAESCSWDRLRQFWTSSLRALWLRSVENRFG